jgi:ATP-binding protein involved in chromosome partitioning
LIDPRIDIIASRFSNVGMIIAVSSSKGGVGKSMVSVALALNLAERASRVGLLDLDFTSPSTHLILGVEGLYPKEEKGILPPKIYGLSYMSIVHYSLENPTPLRGTDVSNAIIELLAITRWEDLDYLVIDMPPGLGDATLDMIRFIPKISFLVVSTPSHLAYESVRRLLTLLKEQNVPTTGLTENMVSNPNNYVKTETEKMQIKYLGALLFDNFVEASIGDPEKLKQTVFYNQVKKIAEAL